MPFNPVVPERQFGPPNIEGHISHSFFQIMEARKTGAMRSDPRSGGITVAAETR